MRTKQYTINDFTIGECVVPVRQRELTLVIVDIDKQNQKIICRLMGEGERLVHEYQPGELEKEFIMRPPNILHIPNPKSAAAHKGR